MEQLNTNLKFYRVEIRMEIFRRQLICMMRLKMQMKYLMRIGLTLLLIWTKERKDQEKKAKLQVGLSV